MKQLIFEDLIHVMERGQVTIPLRIRTALTAQKGTKLWIRLYEDNTLLLQPIEDPKKKQHNALLSLLREDTYQYMSNNDEKAVSKLRSATKRNLSKLYEENTR